MIKISWNESEFLTFLLAAVLVFLKAGAVFLFLVSAAYHFNQQSPGKLSSLSVIIPSPRRNVADNSQNAVSNPLFAFQTTRDPRTESTSLPVVTLTPETSSPTPGETPTASYTPSGTIPPASTDEPSRTPTETETITPSVTETPVAVAAITETGTASLSPTFLPTKLSQTAAGTPTLIPLLPWPQPNSKVCSPIDNVSIEELFGIISSPYTGPPPGSDARHEGVDFAYYNYKGMPSIAGSPVHAVLPGKIVGVVNNRLPYGNMVIVETRPQDISEDLAKALDISENQSLYTLYAHMKDSPDVVFGQNVGCGQILDFVGNTGTLVPHLHFETRRGPAGGWFSSMGYFDPDITEEEKSNYLYWRISGTYQHFDPMKFFQTYLDLKR